MKKIKAFFSKSLYLELWLSIFAGLALGIAAYYILQYFNNEFIFSSWVTDEYVPTRVEHTIEDLQDYIDSNNISSSEPKKIYVWTIKHPLIYFYIEKDGVIIYNFYADYTKDDATTISEYDQELIEQSYLYNPYATTHLITLADGECTLKCFEDFQYDLKVKLQILNLIISGAIVIFIITMLVRRKIHYIKEVTSGINILEGGDLNYNIPVKGKDEISHVAESLNSMRVAVSHQMENEKKALQANNSLVTALSHDLRTPLTTQMGYLEILKEHHYSSPEEMDKYVNTALETCTQIKEMSDRLFEYFLAFEPNPKRSEDSLEEYDGIGFLMQIISELSLPLIDQGFRFEVDEPTDEFTIKVNSEDILRIFNNVFTNIDKYADENEPVNISIKKDSDAAFISFTNTIRKTPRKNESSKIGLISISSLMKRQGGSSKTKTSENSFTIELKFPCS